MPSAAHPEAHLESDGLPTLNNDEGQVFQGTSGGAMPEVVGVNSHVLGDCCILVTENVTILNDVVKEFDGECEGEAESARMCVMKSLLPARWST